MTNIWSFDKQRPTIGEIPLERDAEGAILKSLEKLSGKRTMVYWNSGDTLLNRRGPKGKFRVTAENLSGKRTEEGNFVSKNALFCPFVFRIKCISVVIRNKEKVSYIKINNYSESLEFILEEGDFT